MQAASQRARIYDGTSDRFYRKSSDFGAGAQYVSPEFQFGCALTETATAHQTPDKQ
jgi:hypothetical protein